MGVNGGGSGGGGGGGTRLIGAHITLCVFPSYVSLAIKSNTNEMNMQHK